MLRRSTKVQLILFVVITLVGVSYVSAEYVGLTKNLFGDSCTAHADFSDSGGIFTNAEVTYRGVAVGQVGEIHLRDKGIRVDLDIEDCGSAKIPADTAARVANRSVVGEQYVDLTPKDEKGPYLEGGSVIPQSRTSVPTPTNLLLSNLNSLVTSLPLDALRTTVSELGKAFDGRGNDLATLIDSSSLLLGDALQNLPDTIALIENSERVLTTQLDSGNSIRAWAENLRLLSAQLKTSDPDIRRLLDTGPEALTTVQNLIEDNRTDLGSLLANLVTVGDIIVAKLDGVEQIFELYPALAAGGQSVLRDNPFAAGRKVGALGLVLGDNKGRSVANDPPDCGDPKQDRQGYNGPRRAPSDLSPQEPNTSARCTAPVGSGTNVRGSANVPGGDPISTAGGNRAYPRPITSDMLQIDTTLQRSAPGEDSWKTILTASLR